jgi:hypothetical protein
MSRIRLYENHVPVLTWKLIERLSGYVEAKRPGDKDDVETEAFINEIKREAEDSKKEIFGVEVSVYSNIR